MKMHLIAPLVYFYPEEYNDDPNENTPDSFMLGKGFRLEKIITSTILPPLLKTRHARNIISGYERSLINDYAGYAILRDYYAEDKGLADTSKTKEIRETKRILGLLKMAFGISKRTHLIFQDFHLKDGSEEPVSSTSLSLEGSRWSAHRYYPEEIDVSFSHSDLKRVALIFKHLLKLSEGYTRVFNACYYFEMARLKGDSDYRLQFSLLVTSLESIFNTSSNQVSETLAIRYAHLMLVEPSEKIDTYNKLKEIYKLRSHIVHGQKIPKKYLDAELQDRLLGELEYLTRKLLIHIFEKNLIDELNNTEVENYFAKISLDA